VLRRVGGLESLALGEKASNSRVVYANHHEIGADARERPSPALLTRLDLVRGEAEPMNRAAFLDGRTAVLDITLGGSFRRVYPVFQADNDNRSAAVAA
jgi:hypothetical protein